MINPINHTSTPMAAARYKVEPYVMAADVYGEEPHTGRGGWTWYTGASGWMYRVCIEHILGLKIRGSAFTIEPSAPRSWGGYSISYTYKSTIYEINIKNPPGSGEGTKKISLDGKLMEDNMVPLLDDGIKHNVEVTL